LRPSPPPPAGAASAGGGGGGGGGGGEGAGAAAAASAAAAAAAPPPPPTAPRAALTHSGVPFAMHPASDGLAAHPFYAPPPMMGGGGAAGGAAAAAAAAAAAGGGHGPLRPLLPHPQHQQQQLLFPQVQASPYFDVAGGPGGVAAATAAGALGRPVGAPDERSPWHPQAVYPYRLPSMVPVLDGAGRSYGAPYYGGLGASAALAPGGLGPGPRARGRGGGGEALATLEAMDKAAETYVLCHHGIRSRSVADALVRGGWERVINVEGGIHAYALEVDSSVGTY